MGRTIGFSSEAKELLVSHAWPGNIRELENTISRLVFISSGDYIDAKAVLSVGGMDITAFASM